MRSRGTVLFVAIVLAIGGAGWWIFREHERETSHAADDSASDASADARVADGKKKKGKHANKGKPSRPRGGTTRVAARRPSTPTAGGPNAWDPVPNPIAPDPGGPAAGGNEPPSSASDEDNGGGPSPRPRHRPRGGGPSGPSFESALANGQTINMGDKGGSDLTDAQLSAPMADGSFVGDCDAPDDMGVTVKVAIRSGRAIGVSVYTSPQDADVAGCIQRHVRGLSWPSSPKTDSFVTTY